jgi:4-amino-4-deoxy-L-arabinose transferase-like glycosyltransferase
MRTIVRRPGLQVIALTVFAVGVRLLALHLTGFYGQVINNDGYSYNQIAGSLLHGQGFAWGPGQPTAFRLFGYPWLLAAVYRVFGRSTAMLHVVQALLGGLIVVPVYLLARRLGGAAVAVVASLAVALHPVLIFLTALTAPDAAAVLCEMMLIWLAARCADGKAGLGTAAILVLLGAVAILLRPELLMVVWLLPAGFLVVTGPRPPEVRTLAIVALLATLLAAGPAALRNWHALRILAPFPTIGGVTFLGGNNAEATGGWVAPAGATWADDEPPPLGMQGWPGLSEEESQARFYAASWHWIRSDPGAAAALVPLKLARAWTLSYSDESRDGSLPPAATWLNLGFGLLALAGMAIALRRRDRRLVAALLFIPVVAVIAKTVLFYGSARQTGIALPVLCVFAAEAVVYLTVTAASAATREQIVTNSIGHQEQNP